MSVLTKYQKAALEYNKHISLTANAGSGKTTVLSKRYVEILINEKVSFNNIVAITFTEKAASELYSKIATEIEDRISKTSGWKKNKLETLRRSLVSAKISTIHSFCIDILKDYAPEAGIDANFSPIDARTTQELLEQSIDEVINKKLREEDNRSIKNLIRIFGNKTLLGNKIKQMFEKRKTIERLIDNQFNKSDDEISEQMQVKFEKYFTELFETQITLLIENINLLNSVASGYKSSSYQIEIERLLNEINSKNNLLKKFDLLNDLKKSLLTSKGEVRKMGYLSKELYEEYENVIGKINYTFGELKNIEIDENYSELNKELAFFGKTIANLYINVREKYVSKKRQKSYLDFEDLLLYTQKLLLNDNVKNALSEKYKYVMVDEYQDTNEIQYNIFMPILKNLSTGNLFVVGDEKQSIYMFREAEVEVFNTTKKQIAKKESTESILDLPHSFRLAPNIALFTNVLFSKLFREPNEKFNEVKYNELVCAYQNKAEGEIEFLIADEEKNVNEYELVAKRINELTGNSRYSFGDIAVLCKKRKNFLELEKGFAKYNIPFSIVGGKGFFQQQLVLDIYNYLSFLINPQNDVALTGILRGPYFNLSDVLLTEISFQHGKSFYNKLQNYSQKNDKVKDVVKVLNKHINLISKTEIGELIRTINIETGYLSYISNKRNGVREVANLEKLIHKAINITEQGFHTLYDFINFLKDAINNLEDEGQADLDNLENAVKIMTIHQAKGLEFKVVILYKTNQKNFDETIKSKEISIDKEFGILAKLPLGNNYFEDYHQAPIVGLYNYIQNKKSVAELKRLLYVAVTRAEEHLIISLSHKNQKLSKDSFASMITGTLNIDLIAEDILIKDKLTKMEPANDEYVNSTAERDFTIKIIHDIKQEFSNKFIDDKEEDRNYKILIENIKSSEKNEIISASKISLFLQCPRKYQLTYEFGYGQIIKQFSENYNFEYNTKEDDETVSGNIFGSIVHNILEKEIPIKNLQSEIDNLIEKEEETLLYSKNKKKSLSAELLKIISEFYKSESYLKLKNYSNYKNEIEIYKREKDYYLYGIIDKLIFDKDKIIIVDYKSDKISAKTIDEKKETYFNQLLFYSYVLINKYPKVKKFELQLIFLRDDSQTAIKKIDRKEISEFGDIIKDSVYKIRAKRFDENAEGCKNMDYYLLSECEEM